MALNLSYVRYFCLSNSWIFVCLMLGFIVCLVSSFRYNGLATLDLAAFGRVRALLARCGPFGPAIALKGGERGSVNPVFYGILFV